MVFDPPVVAVVAHLGPEPQLDRRSVHRGRPYVPDIFEFAAELSSLRWHGRLRASKTRGQASTPSSVSAGWLATGLHLLSFRDRRVAR
jgi:hypothetical protein